MQMKNFSVYQITCIFNTKEKRFACTVCRLLKRETDVEKCYFSWRLLLEAQIWGAPSTHSYCTSNCYAYQFTVCKKHKTTLN